MLFWTVAGVVLAGVAAIWAYMAWRDARPYEPFEIVGGAGVIFGLRRTGSEPVRVVDVVVPHHTGLTEAATGRSGPWELKRGETVFFNLDSLGSGIKPPSDLRVCWQRRGRVARLLRRSGDQWWLTTVLPS